MKKAEKGTESEDQSVEEHVASCAKSLVELQCEFCSRVCFSNNELEEHIKIRHSNNKYTCKVCGKGFSLKSSIARHMQIHEDVSTFKCALCLKAHRTRYNLAAHMRTHNSEKAFQCNKCPATFGWKNSMQRHLLSHTDEKPYECPVKCGRRFATLHHQRRHAMTHLSNMQKYVCAYCKKEWLWKDNLRKHISLRHANDSPPEYQLEGDMTASGIKAQYAAEEFSTSFPIVPGPENTVEKQLEELECQFCNRVCFSNNELQEHMKIRHSNKKYMCDVCGKGFSQKSYLPEHIRIHEGVFPYQCALCPKVCRTKSNLADHMYTHSGEKPFKCDRCPATFNRKASMIQHKFSYHTNKKLYECPMECGRRFATLRNQRRHARIHTNKAQKYVCAYCKKEHSLKRNLQKHIFSRHVDESPSGAQFVSVTTTKVGKYECAYCKKECSRKYNLRVHIFWRHANESPPEAQCASGTTFSETEVKSAANHTNEVRKYECAYCKKKFSWKYNLRRHILSRHANESPPEDSDETTSETAVQSAVNHTNKVQKYECAYCKRECSQKGNLRRHIFSRHANESPPEAQCASDITVPCCLTAHLKRTASKTEVQSAANHMNKVQRYEGAYCKIEGLHCGFDTEICFSKNDLKVHKKNRRCYKKGECPVCGKSISRKSYLKGHIRRMHANEFPYTCKACPDAFKTQSELVRHICNMLIHPGGKPYKCDRCLATFTMREYLQQHNRLTHRKSTENKSIKIKKEETLSSGSEPVEVKEETMECSFQTHFAVKLEETPRYGCEPAEVNNWETIKCTFESVEVKKEHVTGEEYLELKAQLERERTLRMQLEKKLQRLQETIKRTLESDEIKNEKNEQSIGIKREFLKEEI